jgi:hypothetical protein
VKVVYKIGFRILLVAILLVLSNEVYKVFFLKVDLAKHADILELLPEKGDTSKIIYFGESSNFTNHPFDNDKRSISNIIDKYYPEIKIHTANKGALHAGIYKVLLENIPLDNNIETVIITLNLRSFGADWIYSKLENSLQKNILLLKKPFPPLYNRFILSFKGYQIKSELENKLLVHKHWQTDKLDFPFPFEFSNTSDWDKGFANKGIRFDDGSKDYKKTELACHYIKSYAFNITPENVRIKDFDKIVQTCKKRGWKLVFNLMSENMEMANKLVGSELDFLMKRNRDFLVSRYTVLGVLVVDNLVDVPSNFFIDQDWTTEHYTEEGRHIIARNVADSLKRFYPELYQAISISEFQKQNEYTFDAEGESDWKELKTITDEKGYNSQKSSKTGGDIVYGATFEKPFKHIPDTCWNEIEVSFMINFKEKTNGVKLVFEIIGSNNDKVWYGHEIESTHLNDWMNFTYTYDLRNQILATGSYMKIYLLNNSGTIVYTDDWKIRFN